jgi:DNA-binding NarL/FixJ family response regulator
MKPAQHTSGKQAFMSCEWREAFALLSSADAEVSLSPADLERLGISAYMLGRDTDALGSWTRAFSEFVEQGEALRAARVGFWCSLVLLLGGQGAQSGGWLSRTERLLQGQPDSPEHGLIAVIKGLFCMGKGNGDAADQCFTEAAELGEKFNDPDLWALSALSCGQALIHNKEVPSGVGRLDEAMLAVTTGEVSPPLAGIIYCAVIATCEQILDLNRATEWTQALDDWCVSQPQLVAFRGQCLVHRASIMQFKGEWRSALEDTQRAFEMLSDSSPRTIGRALYQQAEIHRLWGDFESAEKNYEEAAHRGFEPQPGLALLRLAQGDMDSAVAAIRRVVGESASVKGSGNGVGRIKLLGPFVQIMLAVGDLEAAGSGANELCGAAARPDAFPLIQALAAQADGAVALAGGETARALEALRRAWTLYQQLEAHYEAACTRLLLSRACEAMGDKDTAKLHAEAGNSVLDRLGVPGASAVRAELGKAANPARLTKREIEVLRLVASGKTNRQIAQQLHISEHTVAHHVSNLFTKTGAGSRTAVGAFAFKHGLA